LVGRAIAAVLALLAATFHCAHALAANGDAKRELTPADAIATVRLMQNQLFPGERSDDSIHSPDGHRYVIRLAYGDVERNGVWLDLRTGSLDTLDAAAHPTLCAPLFSLLTFSNAVTVSSPNLPLTSSLSPAPPMEPSWSIHKFPGPRDDPESYGIRVSPSKTAPMPGPSPTEI
jgi:hypothetical protein